MYTEPRRTAGHMDLMAGGEPLAAPDFADPAETQHEFAEIEAGAHDPSVRNEKQIVADSHAEFPDESIGQGFIVLDGEPRAVHDGGGGPAQHGGHWQRAAVAAAGVGLGALLVERRRRRRRVVA